MDFQTQMLAAQLQAASVRIARLARSGSGAEAVGGGRLSALAAVAKAGPMTLAGLAAAERVRPPTMSRIVDGLVEAGLVTREAKPGDRRSVQIAATDAGRDLLAAGDPRLRPIAERLERLADSERRALARGVEILERVLG